MINTRIRPAVSGDAVQMVALINPLIAAGDNTAHRTLFDIDKMKAHYITPASLICCHVAITNGRLSGFQSLTWGGDDLPDGWASIASFVAIDKSGLGIGQKLFSATWFAAKEAGVTAIDARIRADNQSGLRYYSGLGFEDYAVLPDLPLSDGTPVTRIRKRRLI